MRVGNRDWIGDARTRTRRHKINNVALVILQQHRNGHRTARPENIAAQKEIRKCPGRSAAFGQCKPPTSRKIAVHRNGECGQRTWKINLVKNGHTPVKKIDRLRRDVDKFHCVRCAGINFGNHYGMRHVDTHQCSEIHRASKIFQRVRVTIVRRTW